MRHASLGLMIFFLAAGCAGAPHGKTETPPPGDISPDSVVERFRENLPDKYLLLNSVSFEWAGQRFFGLGLIEVDSEKGSFSVICINPMGPKMFEISGDENGIRGNFTIEGLPKKEVFTEAVGKDIRRMFFGLTPSSFAEGKKKRAGVVFREPHAQGTLRYVFAGEEAQLAEKSLYGPEGLIWRVSYNDYRRENGKLYAGEIILKNIEYGYSLIIRLKEIIDEKT